MTARILVVDDDPHMGELLVAVLEDRGYAVELAASGADALDRIGQTPPDLLLLDVRMPGDLDGLEVTRRLRSAEATVRLPILLLTARSSDDDVSEGFTAGANDYLAKPFGAADLLVRVEALLAATER